MLINGKYFDKNCDILAEYAKSQVSQFDRMLYKSVNIMDNTAHPITQSETNAFPSMELFHTSTITEESDRAAVE